MKLSKRILACAITAAMATSMLSACNGSTTTSGSASDAGTSQGNSSTTENSNSGDNSSTDGNGGSNGGNIVEAPSNGDTLKWLGYYDLNTDDKEIVDKFNDAGYKVETISTSSTEYFTKLAQLVASSDSPDMVRYEWQSYPHGVANNLYTSLDAYVDFDSDTWSGMKDMIENFNYGGKQLALSVTISLSSTPLSRSAFICLSRFCSRVDTLAYPYIFFIGSPFRNLSVKAILFIDISEYLK